MTLPTETPPTEASAPEPEAPAAALQISHVSHSYGKRKALDDVSFSVRPASFTVLLGLNGAGKSTLFSLITRLYGVRAGAISIFGWDVSRTPGEALRRLGVVFQARTLDLDLSVEQNLRYHAALHGMGTAETKARSADVLAKVDMLDRVNDKVRALSGGQMRRVEIARALLHRPRMLLLDEATVGLDVKARSDILSHVRGLIVSEGIGVLWATHLIDEVRDGDDVVVLHRGKLLDKGDVAEVCARAGAPGMGAAFNRLTGVDATEGN
jgi:ABC-2 type transport system ATP-binding protein